MPTKLSTIVEKCIEAIRNKILSGCQSKAYSGV
ncbi:hypothetical protein NVIE_001650 [Nitrososphaera viennensis EN76]|uniref:Uncharacterized protein n=1 Tax=Nitrososphaera viennensis EN76 TaxID=926571 RepID=A0A060HG55_9ARCH|nr:hypothetical protein NVIE_001650 [Nitrososphaera viennensis EN76]